jgi:hypothetical protein
MSQTSHPSGLEMTPSPSLILSLVAMTATLRELTKEPIAGPRKQFAAWNQLATGNSGQFAKAS